MRPPRSLLLLGLAAGCASVHPGEYAIPLGVPYRGPATPMGLVISGRELTRLATPAVGAVEVTFENTSPETIQIGGVYLDFQSEPANQLVATPPDEDAQAWARSVAEHDAVQMSNRAHALAAVADFGQVVASSGHHHHHHAGHGSSPAAAIGAVLAVGALVALVALAAQDEAERTEQVAFAPETHLLVTPFAIPPGQFVRRWIALDTAAPEIPCLTFFTLAYDTTSGRHERVRLHFRNPDGASPWQRRACLVRH
jgi:hypothetical protein